MNSKNIIPTGFRLLNEILGGGFRNGSLNVIGSRPGMGKTTFAMQCAADMSKSTEKPIYIFSLELSSKQIKTICMDNSNRIIIDDIDDIPWITLSEIRKRLAEAPDIAAIFIDYLQLIDSSAQWYHEGMAEIAEGLRSIAKEMDIQIICTSQLTRAIDHLVWRKDFHPILSDIEESIRQNADTILFVYRDSYYDETADHSTAEIGILKNPYGDCKALPFHWSIPNFSECGIDEMIEYSCAKGQTEFTAFLLEYKNKHSDFTDINKMFSF